jgi:prophage antirepressor-like protein
MNELEVIAQRKVLEKNFKVYGTKDNMLFLAKDVSEWIDYSDGNESHMLSMVDESEKLRIFCTIIERNNGTKPDVVRGSANRMFLTEDGLYEVLMQSRKPLAKEFKKQVKEILK